MNPKKEDYLIYDAAKTEMVKQADELMGCGYSLNDFILLCEDAWNEAKYS